MLWSLPQFFFEKSSVAIGASRKRLLPVVTVCVVKPRVTFGLPQPLWAVTLQDWVLPVTAVCLSLSLIPRLAREEPVGCLLG